MRVSFRGSYCSRLTRRIGIGGTVSRTFCRIVTAVAVLRRPLRRHIYDLVLARLVVLPLGGCVAAGWLCCRWLVVLPLAGCVAEAVIPNRTKNHYPLRG